jgi:hypothetical protein
MTMLGKLLLMFNLAFSLMLAAWSFSLYANRIDWSNNKAKADQPDGEFTVRDAQIVKLWDAVRPAEASWRNSRAALLNQEARRVVERTWYNKQMNHVFKDATAANPIGELTFAAKEDDRTKAGQLVMDNNGDPVLNPLKDIGGHPLKSLAAYNEDNQKVLKSLEEVARKHTAQIEEAIKLTQQLVGEKDGPRGLQQRILDEKAKSAAVMAEQALIRPMLVNTVVQSELIVKRRRALEKRIEELKKIGVASGR